MLARCRWVDGVPTTVELVPFDLGYGRPLTRSGVPAPAAGEVARTIIGRLAELSLALGTTVTPEARGEGTVGVIDLTGAVA